MMQTCMLGYSETYGQEICTLTRALFTALLCVSGVRWAPSSGVITTYRVLNFDHFSTAYCQYIKRRIEMLREQYTYPKSPSI